ncbi:MAG: hypothetical protein ACQGVK_19005 [Myxococcota bacterium]
MNYWRMQLHPSERELATYHSIQSLAAGFIGLDFAEDVGDLRLCERNALPSHHRDYWDFAHTMKPDDLVLVIAHHFPLALARVTGDYNYISRTEREIGVWFRHFRRAETISHYADVVTDVRTWEQVRMTDTISILKDPSSKSRQLIDSWCAAI